MNRWPALAAALVVLAGAGVARAQPDRGAVLRQTLLARHREQLARDPAVVAEMLARMARTKFAFFRGAGGLLLQAPSRFVTPAAARVAVMGDPHPENIGAYRTPRGERVVDFNDFDLAGYGPYVGDLRRLAVGLWIVADMADMRKKQRPRVIESLASGYVAEIDRLRRGQPPVSLRAEAAFGGALEALLAVAEDEERALEQGTPAGAEDRALVQAALAAYPATLVDAERVPRAAFAIKRVVRVNAGIASYPVLRLRALVEGPGAGDDDDWVLELKEVRKAALLVAIQRQFQEFPDDDRLLGWAVVGGRELRVRQVSPDQRRLSVERVVRELKSPRWGKHDLRDFAQECGRLLARGHARAKDESGRPGLVAVAEAVGDGRGLIAETVAYAGRAADALEADLELFRALRAQHGPLLGWR